MAVIPGSSLSRPRAESMVNRFTSHVRVGLAVDFLDVLFTQVVELTRLSGVGHFYSKNFWYSRRVSP